ncbi:hypothetical protein KBI52_03340 [Microvirga sp. HBU67558]|uniref:hypothetical protein n=1 Tax=Microvirga TaxID=186650 RepID=UPI001B38F814|nr:MULTISPECIES: hypothetical protein [unclassified Microvirga]MBQ0819267.1 hypothetical protein [Microvirga sp. HBU67558]
MTIYYVSTTGSNGGAGTAAQPFASLEYAHKLAKPGDTINLRGGVYKLSTDIQLTNDGTAAAPSPSLPARCRARRLGSAPPLCLLAA